MPPSYQSIGQHHDGTTDDNISSNGVGFVRVVEGKNADPLALSAQLDDDDDDGNYSDSMDEVPSDKLLSPLEASIHLVKGNLGPGCLNLPHAFAIAGWGLGSGLFALVALQGIYSMWLLVQCKNLLHAHYYERNTTHADDHHPKIHTFMEVARAALGPTGGRVVEVFLFVLQGGVCCVFLGLLSTNLISALPFLSSTMAVLLVTLVVSVMVLLRFLKDLVWLSASANSIMISAILTASLAGLLHWMRRDVNSYDAPAPISHRPLSATITFTSDMFFAFEGIGLVLPIENSFSARRRMSTTQQPSTLSFDQILIRSMCVTAMLFLLVGLPAVFGFPDIQSGSVTAYLKERYPQQLWFSFVNAMVMVAVALTFPLQLQPAMQVLDQWIDENNGCGCGGAACIGNDEEDPDFPSASDGDIEIERVSLHEGRRASPLRRRSSSSLSRSLSEQLSERSYCCGPSEYTWLFRRWAVVVACSMIVLLVDDLGVLMALFGAVGQTGLAAMPCAIHLALQRQGVAPKSRVRTVIDFSIVLFCGAVMLTGCTLAIKEIAEEK